MKRLSLIALLAVGLALPAAAQTYDSNVNQSGGGPSSGHGRADAFGGAT